MKSTAENFLFQDVLRPGDQISFGQACSEPVGLVRELLRQANALRTAVGRLKLFVAGSYSGLLKPEHAECFELFSYGAFGDGAPLVRAGKMALHPVQYSQIPALLTRDSRTDVVLLQLSAPDPDGRYSLGVASDYQLASARQARVVIAEVNARTPFSPHALLPQDVRIDHFVSTDEPLVEFPLPSIDTTSERIAGYVAGLVPNGATLQIGIGSLMEAICRALTSHRNLGIHTGIMIDGMADLMLQGVVTNTQKGTHTGRSVAASLLGTKRLFEFADSNAEIALVETYVSHGAASLSQQVRFCSINSAIEVDLTGQINGEVSNGRYVGAVGGQVDFVRAAAQSDYGVSIIALPSTAGGGKFSRIVTQVNGPVTTPRSDVDSVVTEWGVARLRGLSLRQRVRAMAGVAHPDHRERLLSEARNLPCH